MARVLIRILVVRRIRTASMGPSTCTGSRTNTRTILAPAAGNVAGTQMCRNLSVSDGQGPGHHVVVQVQALSFDAVPMTLLVLVLARHGEAVLPILQCQSCVAESEASDVRTCSRQRPMLRLLLGAASLHRYAARARTHTGRWTVSRRKTTSVRIRCPSSMMFVHSDPAFEGSRAQRAASRIRLHARRGEPASPRLTNPWRHFIREL